MISHITAADAIRMVDQPGTVLLDVRSATEIEASGTAKGALCIPAVEVLRRLRDPGDQAGAALRQAQRVILFCAVGARAEAVAAQLDQHGLPGIHVFNAFRDWAMEGGPVQAA